MELKALTLVNGKDADAVYLSGWDGVVVDALVPRLQEGMDVRWVAAKVVLQLVHKGEDIGILPRNSV